MKHCEFLFLSILGETQFPYILKIATSSFLAKINFHCCLTVSSWRRCKGVWDATWRQIYGGHAHICVPQSQQKYWAEHCCYSKAHRWGLRLEVGLHTNSDLLFMDFPKPQLLLFILNTDKVLGTEGAIIYKIVF